MHRILDKVELVFTWTAVVVTAATMLLTTADALARYLFTQPIDGAFEFTADYLMIVIVFLAAAYSYRSGSFVRVTLALKYVSPQVRRKADYVAQFISAVVAVALVAAAGVQAWRAITSNTMSAGLILYPIGPAHALATFGLLMLALRVIADLWRVGSGESGMQREDSEAL